MDPRSALANVEDYKEEVMDQDLDSTLKVDLFQQDLNTVLETKLNLKEGTINVQAQDNTRSSEVRIISI